MNWTDVTNYSSKETERKPRILECSLTPHITFSVHKHIYYGTAWLITASCVGLDCVELGTTDLTEAKAKAAAIMTQKLRERQSELNTALTTLGHPPTARWLPNGEFAMCSNCHDLFKEREVTVFNYCPECGAKMNLGKVIHGNNNEVEENNKHE